MAIACNAFLDANNRFPAGMTTEKGETAPETTAYNGPNWVIRVLPFMEFDSLYNSFDLNENIASKTDTNNIEARAQQVKTMLCPTDSNWNSKPYIPGNSRGGQMGKTPWARGNYAANSSIAYLDVNAGQGPGGIATEFYLGAGSPGWKTTWARGVMGCNVGAAPNEIPDGQANTALICELRAGTAPMDHRGTWALGECGGSTLWGFGCCGDAGVNARTEGGNDDVFEGPELQGIYGDNLADLEMEVWNGTDSWQSGCRSLHPGGAHIAMCDASVHFIDENIACNQDCSYNINSLQVWERLMAAGDGQAIDSNSW
jgi:prepilin-type processing-associated H-X9-DG protein